LACDGETPRVATVWHRYGTPTDILEALLRCRGKGRSRGNVLDIVHGETGL
jgi:hypothetical protein